MNRRTFLKNIGITTAALSLSSCQKSTQNSTDKVLSDKKPNILFIMTDQQFAEIMSCRMGTKYINTPAMDSLANDGILFTNAYSPNPLCMPARNSIFTGRYPHETGCQNNSGGKLDPVEFPNMGT
ncbi:MAG: sulfatase-like hydrolase/transferase, partial [Deltaproteobacteria bacterium]|nr:sulfatase-like hydrolase/transferase [Deltaproteobacteria bacterium]